MIKKAISVVLAFFALFTASAQTAIRVEVPEAVEIDEQFNITFVIEGEDTPSDFQWEPGSDFQLVWGPQKGSSTSVSIINGKRSRSSQTTYTYVLLPRKTGTLAVQPARAVVANKEIVSPSRNISVVSGGSRSGQSSSQGGSQSSDPGVTGDIPKDELFMRLSLSRTNVVVGEPITATLKLYQRVNIAGFEDAHFPSFNGFWSQEVEAPQNIEFRRESLDDMIYNSAVLRSWTLIPQQAGDIKIDPAELVCLVNVRAPSRGNSIFDSFFQDDYRTIRKRVVTPAMTVHVSKLPAGAPASFGGGVGKFNISASVSKDSLLTHDAASLTVTISGNGNLTLLEAPKIAFPSDFEVYDAKTSDRSGSKSFEYPFIPRSHGDFIIPSIEYSYYDISAGKYVTVSTDPIEIRVGRGSASQAGEGSLSQQGSVVIRKDVKDLGSDIRYIATSTSRLTEKGGFLVGSVLFFVLLALTVVATGLVWLVFRKMAARRADVVGARNRGAVKMARKRLTRAGEYLSQGLSAAFYEELHRALLGFASDKLNIDTAEMSRDNIVRSLGEYGIADSLAEDFGNLIDACEYARYAPDSGNESMNAHYHKALEVISSIDSSMKNSKSRTTATMLLALLLIYPSVVYASDQPVGDIWQLGCAEYAEGRWEDAALTWLSLESEGFESPELYYNIGNAWYKAGNIAQAILYYERALKLNPSYDDARFNLEFANAGIQDHIESVPEFFFKQWIDAVSRLLSSDSWTILFFVLLASAMACGLVFFLSGISGRRKWAFYGGLCLLVLAFFSLGFAAGQRRDYNKRDEAVVVRPVSSVKSAPTGDMAKDLFILHEGTKVRIIDKVGDWSNISLSDGRQGWIRVSDIEVI